MTVCIVPVLERSRKWDRLERIANDIRELESDFDAEKASEPAHWMFENLVQDLLDEERRLTRRVLAYELHAMDPNVDAANVDWLTVSAVDQDGNPIMLDPGQLGRITKAVGNRGARHCHPSWPLDVAGIVDKYWRNQSLRTPHTSGA